jgi:hypothetical protein
VSRLSRLTDHCFIRRCGRKSIRPGSNPSPSANRAILRESPIFFASSRFFASSLQGGRTSEASQGGLRACEPGEAGQQNDLRSSIRGCELCGTTSWSQAPRPTRIVADAPLLPSLKGGRDVCEDRTHRDLPLGGTGERSESGGPASLRARRRGTGERSSFLDPRL